MRARAGFALAFVLAAGVPACGEDGYPEMMVQTWFRWNEDPASNDDIGYLVSVDVGWPSRVDTCFDLWPGLHVTVNGGETTSLGVMGDCRWDVLFEAPVIKQDGPVTVRVLDGDRLMGEAIYEGVFPGFRSRLGSPADGRVRAGDPVSISIPSGFPAPQVPGAHFYWRNTAENVPPYATFSPAQVSPDGLAINTTAPALDGRTGPAALIITTAHTDLAGATTCTGFSHCLALLEFSLGPVEVEVIPAQ